MRMRINTMVMTMNIDNDDDNGYVESLTYLKG